MWTDFSAEPDVDSQVDATVAMLIDRLATEIGTPQFPDDHYSATAAIWDLPNVVVQLAITAPDKRVPFGQTRTTSMYLTCPAAKA